MRDHSSSITHFWDQKHSSKNKEQYSPVPFMKSNKKNWNVQGVSFFFSQKDVHSLHW